MSRQNRLVEDRQKSLQPNLPRASITLAGARLMYEGIQGKEFSCTISGYCRTRIFEFPRVTYRENHHLPHGFVYSSQTVQACIVTDLVDYFAEHTRSRYYAISPSLRHEVNETYEKIKSQKNGLVPVFLIIEEYNKLTPVEMNRGECCICNETREEDGEWVPILVGGRNGEQFIIAWHTVDGAWPELPDNQDLVYAILAGVRVGQEMADPIRKYLDQNCLVTDDGLFAEMMRPTMSARGSTARSMGKSDYMDKVSEIKSAIGAIEKDIGMAHIALLVKSIYRDEYKEDAYERLQYLRIWESLAEAGGKYLGYQGNVREDDVIVAGNKTLRELKQYRNDIAHWWTDTIDENFLVDLQRTINELVRRKYF